MVDAYGGEQLGHDLVGEAVEVDIGEATAAGAHELNAGDAADGAEHDLQVGRRHALRQPPHVQRGIYTLMVQHQYHCKYKKVSTT